MKTFLSETWRLMVFTLCSHQPNLDVNSVFVFTSKLVFPIRKNNLPVIGIWLSSKVNSWSVFTNTSAALFDVIHNDLILPRHIVGSRSIAVNFVGFPDFWYFFFLITYMALVPLFSYFLIHHYVPWVIGMILRKNCPALFPCFSNLDFFFYRRLSFCVVFFPENFLINVLLIDEFFYFGLVKSL